MGIPHGLTVLGLDPGLAALGWGVVRYNPATRTIEHVAHGCEHTSARAPMAQRVDILTRRIMALVEQYEPFEIAAESWVWYGRAVGAGIHTIRVCGAIRAVGVAKGLAVAEYSARAIKLAVTGSANGEKLDMQRAVRRVLKLATIPRPNHAADALGAAITHLATLRSDLTIVSNGAVLMGGEPEPVTKRPRGASKRNGAQ